MKFVLTALILLVTVLLAWGAPIGDGDPQNLTWGAPIKDGDPQSLAPSRTWECTFPSNAPRNAKFTEAYIKTAVNYSVYGREGDWWSTGKSGYPHQFRNLQGFTWGIGVCDHLRSGFILYEFPVYNDNKRLYNKDVKRDTIEIGPSTPYRVVYTNGPGYAVVCGVMSHLGQEKDNINGGFIGSGNFSLCT
ncbi:hypothetical protein KC323_g5820 [Hortaea werneckii]|nr:hypothetical protein KC323_g5820 [Hortaea werneckii]